MKPFSLSTALIGIWLLLAGAGAPQPLSAQEKSGSYQAPHVEIRPAAGKIRIDGVLDEADWANAAVLPVSTEWMPGDNIEAPVRAECLLTFDTRHLYVAFRCFDPKPGQIRAHIMDRDSIDSLVLDDHISFWVDSFNDERRAFQFRVNPLGVQADAIFSELQGAEDFSWDAIWSSAGKITSWGYAIEMAIPFSQLRFAKLPGPQTWGLSAERSWPRDRRHRISSHHRNRSMNCWLCQFNKVSGLVDVSPGRNLEFSPTLTVSNTEWLNDDKFPPDTHSDSEEEGTTVNPGLTVKWGITPNIILNAAVNPDFSQIEADSKQLDVNTRFALRYPEKRPFFLEGADFFTTPIEAVFTRSVADPMWGGKVSGKMGKTAFGLFATRDKQNNLVIPENAGSTAYYGDERVLGGVFRLRRDIGRGSTVGLLYTGRTADEYFNHVAGVDGFIRLSTNNTISFQYLHSRTDYPQALSDQKYKQKTDAFGGDAVNVQFGHFSRNWQINTSYQDITNGFRIDSGFLNRVDTRTFTHDTYHVFWGRPGDWFNRIYSGSRIRFIYDHDGDLTDRYLNLSIGYSGFLQSDFEAVVANFRERYNGRDYNFNQFTALVGCKPISGLRIQVIGTTGRQIDYRNFRLATVFQLLPTLECSIGRHINLNFNHTLERMSLHGEKIYTANLLQSRIVYHFNTRTFLRAIVQYNDLTRNPAMYRGRLDAHECSVFTQFLFSYKLNPQTVFFLGYSDKSLQTDLFSLSRSTRTFFLKIAYALQM